MTWHFLCNQPLFPGQGRARSREHKVTFLREKNVSDVGFLYNKAAGYIHVDPGSMTLKWKWKSAISCERITDWRIRLVCPDT